MKRLVAFLAVASLCALPIVATAGDYHTGGSLVCSDCHVAHYSQSHGYNPADGDTIFTPLGPDGPYDYLLRNDPNDLCLTCHNNQSFAPDVFGDNLGTARVRRAGAINVDAGHVGLANDTGYEETDGHSLWSHDDPPGKGTSAYVAPTDGLECVSCHAQHGSATQYRNLLNRGIFTGKTVTYAIGTNDGTKDVYELYAKAYSDSAVFYNEPTTTAGAYGNWCGSCHQDFHGSGGSVQTGSASGGDAGVPWIRHPVADVNIGAHATHISSLTVFNSRANRVKVMDSQNLWDGTSGDNTVTPSCMSCHKSHGNKNGFGLIYMRGTGTVTEQGDDGDAPRDLCKQCHVQG